MAERDKIAWKLIQMAIPVVLAFSFASMGVALEPLSCKVVEGAIPEGYTEILGMSDRTNAHAELPDKELSGDGNYNYHVVCKSDYVDIGTSDGKEFALLSSETNAHTGTPDDSSYPYSAWLDSKPSGTHVNITHTTSSSCGSSYVCIATLSSSDNAHVASCKDGENYSLRLCGRIVDNTPPEISCDNCIIPRAAETGQEIKIEPDVDDKGFGVDSVDVCLDRQCSEVICGSTDCTYVSDDPENHDIYVRAVDVEGNSVTERIGGMFIGYPIGESCSDNSQCISGNCDDGVCSAQEIPPDVEFSRSGGEIDVIQMGILERRRVNISISNLLPFSDSVNIRFAGRAAKGLVAGNISEGPRVDCNDGNSVCNVSVPANSDKQISALIQGLSVGSGALKITARSGATDLEAEDSIEINTRPRTEDGPVSAPGMTGIYLFALLAFATLYIFNSRSFPE